MAAAKAARSAAIKGGATQRTNLAPGPWPLPESQP